MGGSGEGVTPRFVIPTLGGISLGKLKTIFLPAINLKIAGEQSFILVQQLFFNNLYNFIKVQSIFEL